MNELHALKWYFGNVAAKVIFDLDRSTLRELKFDTGDIDQID